MYDKNRDYGEILDDIHGVIKIRMQNKTLKKNAMELQNILQDIKTVANHFNSVKNSVIGQEMYKQYYELIETSFKIQSQYHNKNLRMETLFRRGKDTKTVKEADNIFEEDLAAIMAAGEFLGGNEDIEITAFLTGGKRTGTKATKKYKLQDVLSEKKVENILKKIAEKEGKRMSSEVTEASGKVDVSGKNITLNYTKELPIKVNRLMHLLKDATISAKSYSSNSYDITKKRDWTEIGLHLGDTNLYKAITGAVTEAGLGYKQATSFFFRGANHILSDDGYGEKTRLHFSHLRFIYELRGSGLLDERGLIMPVKYIIYNDPSSDIIYVKDTASIILEAFEKSYRNANLTGEISIAASKIRSK